MIVLQVTTNEVVVWHIQEYGRCQLPAESVGQFFSGDSFVVKWSYTLTITGRELSGQPSKHMSTGRDRCIYFCWQGEDAPIVDQGAAALQTVELDEERNPQLRVVQGQEHPAFLNLFTGSMVVYSGKRDATTRPNHKLFVCRGETEHEAVLVQVSASMRNLRSAASFVYVNLSTGLVIVWHGYRSPEHTRNVSYFLPCWRHCSSTDH
jgi:supervillin